MPDLKALKNPFVLSGYYGKAYFCDRNEEFSVLNTHFENERNTVLYSWRRMGKTALIKHFQAELEQTGQTHCIYVDLLGTNDISMAVKQIVWAVYERYGKTSSGISAAFQRLMAGIGIELSFDPLTSMPKLNLNLRQGQVPDSSLNAIGTFLSKQKKRILICLDEFQQIANYPEGNAEAVFRAWMQSFPEIRFLFSGSHRTMMQSMFSENNRPFYRSAQILQLGPISDNEYAEFISGHFDAHKKSISGETIDMLFHWSRKQTYCIQLVCNKLFGMYDTISPDQLLGVYNDILKQESLFFSDLSKLLTPTQWQILRSIALEEHLENPLSNDFISKHNLGAASSVQTGLKKLMKVELVVSEDKQYFVQDVLLARWLQSL